MDVSQQEFQFDDDQSLLILYNQKGDELTVKASGFDPNLTSSKVAKSIMSNRQYDLTFSIEERAGLQRTVAQKFITIGYGYVLNRKAIRRKHSKLITASLYNNMMTSVVRRTLRSLQTFLIRDCKQSIAPLSHAEGNRLRSPMIQCVKWMNRNELQTFYKFILNAYNIREERISEDKACRLYGQLVIAARKGHEIDYIILHREKKHAQTQGKEGLTFAYAPSSVMSTNR